MYPKRARCGYNDIPTRAVFRTVILRYGPYFIVNGVERRARLDIIGSNKIAKKKVNKYAMFPVVIFKGFRS